MKRKSNEPQADAESDARKDTLMGEAMAAMHAAKKNWLRKSRKESKKSGSGRGKPHLSKATDSA